MRCDSLTITSHQTKDYTLTSVLEATLSWCNLLKTKLYQRKQRMSLETKSRTTIRFWTIEEINKLQTQSSLHLHSSRTIQEMNPWTIESCFYKTTNRDSKKSSREAPMSPQESTTLTLSIRCFDQTHWNTWLRNMLLRNQVKRLQEVQDLREGAQSGHWGQYSASLGWFTNAASTTTRLLITFTTYKSITSITLQTDRWYQQLRITQAHSSMLLTAAT
jgi:hypothetical protein